MNRKASQGHSHVYTGISRTRCKIETLLLESINTKWCMAQQITTITMALRDLERPSRSFTLAHLRTVYFALYKCTNYYYYCKTFKLGFFIQFWSCWQDFDWYSASHGPSMIAELLVTFNIFNVIHHIGREKIQNKRQSYMSDFASDVQSHRLNFLWTLYTSFT